jgi:flagellar biosynthesis/type III secretory pathway chaperone
MLLIKAREIFIKQNKNKNITGKWDTWLMKECKCKNVGYINKIKLISEIVNGFSKFYNLSTNHDSLYKHRGNLKIMLHKEPYKTFWK